MCHTLSSLIEGSCGFVCRTGKVIHELASLPLAEDIPIAFNSCRQGPRSVGWRSDKPAELVWTEAQVQPPCLFLLLCCFCMHYHCRQKLEWSLQLGMHCWYQLTAENQLQAIQSATACNSHLHSCTLIRFICRQCAYHPLCFCCCHLRQPAHQQKTGKQASKTDTTTSWLIATGVLLLGKGL